MTRQRTRVDGESRMRSRWRMLVVWAVLAAAVCLLGWSVVASGQTAVEEEYWLSVKDSKKAAEIQSYITKYPNGTYVSAARQLLNALQPPPAPAPSAPGTPPAPTRVTVVNVPGNAKAIASKFVQLGFKTLTVEARDEGVFAVKYSAKCEADPLLKSFEVGKEAGSYILQVVYEDAAAPTTCEEETALRVPGFDSILMAANPEEIANKDTEANEACQFAGVLLSYWAPAEKALCPSPAQTSAPPAPVKPPAPTRVTVELYSKTRGVTFTPKQRFPAIPGQTVSVRASKEGYKPVEKDILVEARDMVVELGPLQRQQAPTPQPIPTPQPVRPTPQPPVTSPQKWTNSLGMAFILIPSGSFMMGSTTGNPNEQPVHQVRISTAFYLGQYEVTQAQWQAVMGNNPSHFKGDPNLPVELVLWEEVEEFIRRLNARESGGRYRLPTEAEWEYAARAGNTGAYSFGDDVQRLRDYAWYDDNAGQKTHSVGQKRPNAWGLYDMHGNVWEWVQDVNGAYASAPFTDPLGPPLGSDRVFRGGAFSSDARGCRSASRSRTKPERRNVFLGFRLLRTVP